jgi:hypothetical protein
MQKPKAKRRDRSKENRITVAVALRHETNAELQKYAVNAERSVSWCVNKAVSEWLKTVSA